jgi:hypothetical protein
MAAIVLGLCCVSSMLGGGGYLAYNEMKKSQLEEAAIQRQETFAKIPGLHVFYECDYKGDGVLQVIGESLPKTTGDESIIDVGNGLKSLIITSGYKVDTYDKQGLTGVKITYSGPQNMRCLKTPIKSLKFYKA